MGYTRGRNNKQYKKQHKIDELAEKNRVYLLEQDLEKVQAENEELNGEIKENINKLNTRVDIVQVALNELDDENV